MFVPSEFRFHFAYPAVDYIFYWSYIHCSLIRCQKWSHWL